MLDTYGIIRGLTHTQARHLDAARDLLYHNQACPIGLCVCKQPYSATRAGFLCASEADMTRRRHPDLICGQCGIAFRPANRNWKQKHCSDRCKGLACGRDFAAMGRLGGHPKANVKIRNLICTRCGKAFIAPAKRSNCPDCAGWRVEAEQSCVVCGGGFRSPNNKKTCSPSCDRAWKAIRQRGDKSHRWQGGKTDETMLFRNSFEYSQWRDAVFTRDDYTCQLCFERGGKLAAHHIREFSKYPDLRLDVRNGVTLCWPCHGSVKGRERMYEQQFFDVTGFSKRQLTTAETLTITRFRLIGCPVLIVETSDDLLRGIGAIL